MCQCESLYARLCGERLRLDAVMAAAVAKWTRVSRGGGILGLSFRLAGNMDARLEELTAKLTGFVEDECIPAEALFEAELKASGKHWGYIPAVMERLKTRAK